MAIVYVVIACISVLTRDQKIAAGNEKFVFYEDELNKILFNYFLIMIQDDDDNWGNNNFIKLQNLNIYNILC